MPAKHANAPDFTQVMASDRHRLQQQFRKLPADDQGKAAASWLERFNTSRERVAERARLIPRIIYPDALPIADKREQIKAAIAEHQVVLIAGEIGSGKTT